MMTTVLDCMALWVPPSWDKDVLELQGSNLCEHQHLHCNGTHY